MTYSTSTPNSDFWDFGFAQPQPTQDTDLLKQLNFVPGLKEFLMLRQVHALEHATVWVLEERFGASRTGSAITGYPRDKDTLGGLSTDEGFYLYGEVHLPDLRRAVPLALRRITKGEWDLAVHPRCGTNLSVGMFLTAGLALGSHLVMPPGFVEQMLGLGLATAAANQLTPELGSLAQKYLTTAIPFNIAVEGITATSDIWGSPVHFVRVRWKD
ncbi:MAG: hypothetical protein F6K31_41385 [Symploca sp. SIO2G7]|nr:hypothetical protein [Symploca sp. SIO2G7]